MNGLFDPCSTCGEPADWVGLLHCSHVRGGRLLSTARVVRPSERRARSAAVILAWLFSAVALFGCGASALRAHASAATVLTVAHAGVADLVVATVDTQSVECEARPGPERAPCVDTLRAVAEPAALAVDATRTAVVAYREAVSVAAAAEAGEDVVHALAVALARVVRTWDSLAASMRALGADVPDLPASVRALLDVLAGGEP